MERVKVQREAPWSNNLALHPAQNTKDTFCNPEMANETVLIVGFDDIYRVLFSSKRAHQKGPRQHTSHAP